MRGALLITAVALGLTLAMAAPVLKAPAERLFGEEIVGRHHDAYTMATLFEKPPSEWTFSQPVTDRVGVEIARWAGGVRALNILVLTTFPLAALFAFLLARHFGLPGWAASIAALAFAFSPAHVAHSAYHPHIAQVHWIPLYFLALARCLERWTPGRAALLLVSGGLLVLSNFYAGLFALLLTPPALAVCRPPAAAGRRSAWRATVLTLVGGGLAGWVYLRLGVGPFGALAGRFAFPQADLQRYSARWYSYLLPPVDHPLAGGRLWAFWGDRQVADGLLEQQLSLGLGLLALAAVAVLGARRRSTEIPGGRGIPLFLAVGVAAFLASLAPPPSAGPWPAPAVPAMLYPVVPMFRAYARLGLFAQLMVALLAAVGAATLARRGRGGKAVAAALLVLAVVELTPFPPWRWHHVLPTHGHRWVASQPGPWRLLDCARAPPAVARSILQFLPQPGSLLSQTVPDCAEPGLPAKLATLGFSHLLLRQDGAEERWYSRRGLPEGLTEARRFEDSRVLRVTAPPASLLVARWQGFSWREYAGERTYRWLGPSGEWRVENRGRAPVTAWLEVELWTFDTARDLVLRLDGGASATLRVGLEPALQRAGPFALAPGEHRLIWQPQGPVIAPDEILGNGDTRRLSVAVGGWSWRTETTAGRNVASGGG